MGLGTLLKENRLRKQLTQKQLADKLGVSTSAVNKWERNSTAPDISMLLPISKVLEIPTDDIIHALEFRVQSKNEGENKEILYQEYFLEILEKVTDGFFVVDSGVDGLRVIYVSEKASEYLGSAGDKQLTKTQLNILSNIGELCYENENAKGAYVLAITKCDDFKNPLGFLGIIQNRTHNISNYNRATFEIELRQALTSDAVISLFFDMTTGKRTYCDSDKTPGFLDHIQYFQEFISLLIKCMHKEDMTDIVVASNFIIAPESICPVGKREQFTCRMLNPEDDDETYKWYRFVYTYVEDPKTEHNIFHIIAHAVEENESSHMRASAYVDSDYLTGLPNRLAIENFCHNNLEDSRLRETINVLALIEIDNYEAMRLNEDLDVHDTLIRFMSDSMKPFVEKDMVAARFADATFVIAMHDIADLEWLKSYLTTILNAMQYQRDDESEGHTVSIGAAICKHDPASGYECCFNNAKQALLAAKQFGTKQIVINNNHNMTYITQPTHTNPMAEKEDSISKVSLLTFGFFDVYIDGNPIPFKSKKAKELLAILVDRRGGFVTSDEAISYLWEDEAISDKIRGRYRRAVMELNRTLQEHKIENIIEVSGRKRRIIPERVLCDLFQFLWGNGEEVYFNGNYMTNYSWGESTRAELTWMEQRDQNQL